MVAFIALPDKGLFRGLMPWRLYLPLGENRKGENRKGENSLEMENRATDMD